MARIIYGHPTGVWFTDLDFWDARRILGDVAVVKRNFGQRPPGSEFPTQVAASDLTPRDKHMVEKRLRRAITSPARHVVVEIMLRDGVFEFDPRDYYPERWPPKRMMHFTRYRMPLNQPALCSPYRTVRVFWHGPKIRVERVQRPAKHDPAIQDLHDARRRLRVPSCF